MKTVKPKKIVSFSVIIFSTYWYIKREVCSPAEQPREQTYTTVGLKAPNKAAIQLDFVIRMVLIFKHSCTFYYSCKLPSGNRLIISFCVQIRPPQPPANYYYYWTYLGNCRRRLNELNRAFKASSNIRPYQSSFKDLQNGLIPIHTLYPFNDNGYNAKQDF